MYCYNLALNEQQIKLNQLKLTNNIFTNKMEYHRSPFRKKQNAYELAKSPTRPLHRNQQISFNLKQNSQLGPYQFNKKSSSNNGNLIYEGKGKHITSQMISEFQHDICSKQQRKLSKVRKNEINFDCKKPNHDQNKRFNAKHYQIESKLNKIQNYHHKIESLLQMVNRKPKTPPKNRDFKSPLTPNKTNEKIQSSRSMSRISISTKKEKSYIEDFKQFEQIKNSQYQYGRFTQQNFNIKDQKQEISQNKLTNNNNELKIKINYKQEEANMVKNNNKSQHKRQNRYFQRSFINQILKKEDQIKQSNRKKSKQYMKSIQVQVRDIQNTIESLNEKIKNVDKFSFKKQVAFDNLSTSNPESFSDTNQKNQAQIERLNYQLNTPNCPKREIKINNITLENRQHQTNHYLQNLRNIHARKDINLNKQNQTGYKYQNYANSLSTYKYCKDSFQKMTNPYDGDVSQSDERNQRLITQQLRRQY